MSVLLRLCKFVILFMYLLLLLGEFQQNNHKEREKKIKEGLTSSKSDMYIES